MQVSRYLRALRHIDDLALEWLWRKGEEHPSQVKAPSWPLPETLPSDLTIHWPVAYKMQETRKWMQHLVVALSNIVPVERRPIPQDECFDGCILTHFVYRGRTHRVVIDHWDYIDRICAPALDGATVYFKMQYLREGYGNDRIVPGGYPVSLRESYLYLEKLRNYCDKKPKRYNVYGRFGLRFAVEKRKQALALLSDAGDIGFVGGTDFVRTSRYLRDMARSKIGIDLPGNGDFCFRLVDFLSIGVCVIGPKPRTELPEPLIDGEQIVYCKEDLSDLVPLCRHYLAHEEERARIARNAREYFDRYLHRDALARYYLSQFLTAAIREPDGLRRLTHPSAGLDDEVKAVVQAHAPEGVVRNRP
jgi:hypothetical protein